MTARRARSGGQAIVEFALILPVLLLILMGIFDFGRAIFAFNTLSGAGREGARVAIVNQGDIAPADGIEDAAAEAANQAVGLDLDATDASEVLVSYLLPDLSGACPSHAMGCIAEVRVQFQFQPITPIIGGLIGPIQLSSTTQLPIEFTKP